MDKKIHIVLLAMILSGLPDIGRLFQSDPNEWNLFYTWAHDTWYCYLIPFWNLHIAEDYFLHYKTGGVIQPYYLICEILTWLLMIYLIKRLVK